VKLKRLELKFYWRDEEGEGAISRADADRLRAEDRVTALDFLADVIAAAEKLYNEILASDGVEAGYTGGMNDLSVSTPAAPSVCEWTQQKKLQAFYDTQCGLGSLTHENVRLRCQDYCPNCDRPISFKSEAAR
jgi:hypothetical protein